MTFDPEEWDVVLGIAPEHVAIRIQGRLVPEATQYWDRNALDALVDVAAGGFSGRYRAFLDTKDFDRFRQQVERLDSELNGSATFEAIEDQLHLRLECERTGHVKAELKAMDVAGSGNILRARFERLADEESGSTASAGMCRLRRAAWMIVLPST